MQLCNSMPALQICPRIGKSDLNSGLVPAGHVSNRNSLSSCTGGRHPLCACHKSALTVLTYCRTVP